MIINTIAEGISLSKKLENDSGSFYEGLANKYPQGAETFLALAKENKKNVQNIERTYFGVITDAIEGCYALNLETDNFQINSTAAPDSYTAALEQAIKMEETIIQFYLTAAKQSGALMADVPRAFNLVARKREARKTRLAEMGKG
jgi:rubrerythrin